MLTLYDYFRSSASYRVRIALNLKGLDYQCIPVHLVKGGGQQHNPDYACMNTQHLVPTLVEETNILTQSLAIIEYLDERHPQTPLLPADAYDKAVVRAFALAIAADTHPLNNLRVLNYLKSELHISDDQKLMWYQHWINTTFSALEEQLTHQNKQTAFCFDDSPTLADICLIPQMYNARRFNCDLTPYPTLVRIDAECATLDAFTNAYPKEPVT